MPDTSKRVLRMAKAYLAEGGQVFVDSGAFGAFNKGCPLQDRDFDAHLTACTELAQEAQPGHLYVVAPDRIGDQDATTDLLTRFAPRLRDLAQAGVVIIVPLQRGSRSLSDLFAFAQVRLAPVSICAGLPFAVAALSTDETLAFLAQAKPARAHFLGAARNRRFRDALAEARHLAPATHFTYDAAVIRSICSDLSFAPRRMAQVAATLPDDRFPFFPPDEVIETKTTEARLFGLTPRGDRDAASICIEAERMLDAEEIDITEISPYLNPGDDIAIRAAAYTVGVSEEEFRANMGEGEGREDFENLLGEYYFGGFVPLYTRLLVVEDWRLNKLAGHPVFVSDPHALAAQGMLAF